MSEHLTPTDVIHRLFGGPSGVQAIIGGHVKTTFKWKHGSKFRDAGDIPSARTMRTLLAVAKQRRIGLTAEHLIYGASEAEIAALMPVQDRAQVAA